MNIHLPAILMWTTGVQGFDTSPNVEKLKKKPQIWVPFCCETWISHPTPWIEPRYPPFCWVCGLAITRKRIFLAEASASTILTYFDNSSIFQCSFCRDFDFFDERQLSNSWEAPAIHWSLIIELDDGKIYRKALYLMVKTMVSCRFPLKPTHELIKIWYVQNTFFAKPANQPGSFGCPWQFCYQALLAISGHHNWGQDVFDIQQLFYCVERLEMGEGVKKRIQNDSDLFEKFYFSWDFWFGPSIFGPSILWVLTWGCQSRNPPIVGKLLLALGPEKVLRKWNDAWIRSTKGSPKYGDTQPPRSFFGGILW